MGGVYGTRSKIAFHVFHHFEMALKNVPCLWSYLKLDPRPPPLLQVHISFKYIHCSAEYPFCFLVGCYLLWRKLQILFHRIDVRESLKRPIFCFFLIGRLAAPSCSFTFSNKYIHLRYYTIHICITSVQSTVK